MRSKRSQQLLNARKNEIEIKRQKRETRHTEEEKSKSWKDKQQNAPKATMMMTTTNFQEIVNQFACTGCGTTGKRLTYYLKRRISLKFLSYDPPIRFFRIPTSDTYLNDGCDNQFANFLSLWKENNIMVCTRTTEQCDCYGVQIEWHYSHSTREILSVPQFCG